MAQPSKLNINFIAPERLHPSSDDETIADIAMKLEDRFGIIEKFCDYIHAELLENLARIFLSDGVNDTNLIRITEWIKGEWRDFMVAELHGIKTRAASIEDRKSFIQTGAYYRNLECEVVFS